MIPPLALEGERFVKDPATVAGSLTFRGRPTRLLLTAF
jgi:hypothetical protein